MTFANRGEIIQLAVAQKNKWSVYVSNGLTFEGTDAVIWDFILEELESHFGKDTPKYSDYMAGLLVGGLFFFENEETADDFYRIFEAPLTDSSAVYACLYSNTADFITENTF